MGMTIRPPLGKSQLTVKGYRFEISIAVSHSSCFCQSAVIYFPLASRPVDPTRHNIINSSTDT